MGVYLKTTPTLFCDNISALYMTINHVLHVRIKHVKMDYHFYRESGKRTTSDTVCAFKGSTI